MFRQKCTSLSSQLLKIVTSQWFVQNDTHLARTLNANFLSSKWCLKYSVCTFLFSITMTKQDKTWKYLWTYIGDQRKYRTLTTFWKSKTQTKKCPNFRYNSCFWSTTTTRGLLYENKNSNVERAKYWLTPATISKKVGSEKEDYLYSCKTFSLSFISGWVPKTVLFVFFIFWYGPIWVKYYRAPMIMKSNATICRFWSMSSKVVTGGWRGLAIFHGALERNSAHPSD